MDDGVTALRINPDLTEAATAERFQGLYRYAQVGRCVNGVTHDVNNHLGAVMAYAELVLLDESLSGEARRMLNEVVKGATRCNELISALTTVARKEKLTLNMAEPIRLIEDALVLRTYALKVKQVHIETKFEQGLPTISADAPKVQLALVYLLMNVEEALDGAARRKLRIGLKGTDDGVVYTVWDSGEALPPDMAETIFDPLVTSKENPHLGYGLPAARDIARMHNGDLVYDPDRGFVLTLPRRNDLGSRIVEPDEA